MLRGASAAIIGFVSIVAFHVGCQSMPRPALRSTPEPGKPAASIAKASPAAATAARPAAAEKEAAEEGRKPYRLGNFLIYPLNWRNAEETAFRLYILLYPEYGPNLQIVPDPHNNSLLIYLPPRNLRWKGTAMNS